MRVAILGATGNAGRAVANLLRAHAGHDLRLLGRDPRRLSAAEAEVRDRPGNGAVTSAAVADPAALGAALLGQDLVIVAAPVGAQVGPWAEAALDAGCDWLDVLLSMDEKWAVLRALEPRALAAGRCMVADGGVHPGLPGALVRWAAERVPLRSAAVAMRFGVDWKRLDFSPATIEEFADELTRYDPRVFKDGRWVRGWRYARTFDLGPPLGRVGCAPMFLEELQEVQGARPGVRDVGFWVAGFGPAVDWVAMPAAALLLRTGAWARRPASRLLAWSLSRFGSTRGPSVVLLEAWGQDGRRLGLRLECADAYLLTAAPAVTAVLQWDDARRPGLHTQAGFVDPTRLIQSLPALGVTVT